MCCYILWFFMKAFAPKKGSESCCRSFICVKVCLLLWSIRDSSSGKIAPRELWRCEPRHWEGKHCLHTTWAPVFQGQFFNCRETPQYVWGGHHRILRGLHSIEEIESGTELISESEIILCPFQIRIFCDSMTLWEHKPSAREKDGDTWGEFMRGKKKASQQIFRNPKSAWILIQDCLGSTAGVHCSAELLHLWLTPV